MTRRFRQIQKFLRNQTRSILAAATLLSLSTQANAIGLGTIHVDSVFGQPFAGTVEIFNAEGYDDQSIVVSVASREVHQQLGITHSSYLSNLSVEVLFQQSGLAHAEITGREPLADPYVEFALELRWPQGRVVRDYTVLVNMPNAAVPFRPQIAEPTPASLVSNQPKIPHSSVYRVEFGDTISEIAERLQGREVSLQSATETLIAHNNQLLGSGGAKRLEVGDSLHIPAKEVFSQPAAPAASTTRSRVSSTAPQTAVSPEATIGSPMARAETRLRALGYANLQMQAAGETPNPVVASGAAATILEKLIAEQSAVDPSYGTAQVGRLAEGLNEISNVSRAYQQRLAALENQTRENAELLATLIQQQEALAAETAAVETAEAQIAEMTGGTEVAAETKLSSAPSLTPSLTPNQAATEIDHRLSYLWILAAVVAVASILYFFARRRDREDASAFLVAETVPVVDAAENRHTKESQPLAKPTAQDSGHSEEPKEDVEAPASVVGSDESEETEKTPFYEEGKSESEHSQAEEDADSEQDEQPLVDLDSELDEELKLISIFEENLASETAIREQIKEEEALMSEAMPANPAEDILDFDVDSLEPEDNLEFVLEDSEFEIDAENSLPGMDELLDWQPTESGETSIEGSFAPKLDSADTVPAPQTNTSNIASFQGYAETSGFDQIKPVEVIDIVNSKLQSAKNADQESTLFYIEIDKFAGFEKELGVVRIEKLATSVASNIYDRIENPITLRRFRQQGFVLLLAGGQNQQNLQFGQELASAIASTPIEVSGETFFVTLSIGIVPVASGFSNSAEIIEMAQSAASQVKDEQGGNGVKLCELDPDTAHNEASIMRAGRKLLNDNGFVTVYQPITALKGDPLEFYEARLRIADAADSKGAPDDLIDRLGNTDLSTEIDCLNVSQSIAELNDYLNSHVSTRVFIAISARTATDNFFKNWFEKTVFSEGIHPERIVFQIPEHCASRHLNNLADFRDYAHKMGARICISQVNFAHIPEHALARLHPDFLQLHEELSLEAQHENQEEQRAGLVKLTEAVEKARSLCEKIIVPGINQAKLIPALWPLSVDYIQGDYIQPESLAMDYEFDQVAE